MSVIWVWNHLPRRRKEDGWSLPWRSAHNRLALSVAVRKPPVSSHWGTPAMFVSVSKSSLPFKKTHLAAPSSELTHHSLWWAQTSLPLTSQHLADTQSCYFPLFIPLFIPSEKILTASDIWKSGNHGGSGLHDWKSGDEILVWSSKRTADACILGCFPSLFSLFKLW